LAATSSGSERRTAMSATPARERLMTLSTASRNARNTRQYKRKSGSNCVPGRQTSGKSPSSRTALSLRSWLNHKEPHPLDPNSSLSEKTRSPSTRPHQRKGPQKTESSSPKQLPPPRQAKPKSLEEGWKRVGVARKNNEVTWKFDITS
jgi:hypothetical protein